MKNLGRCCLIFCFLSSFAHGAESYVSLQWGLAFSHSDVDVDVILINHPTYCDSVLYPNPSDAPTDGACSVYQKQKSYTGLYKPDAGSFTSLAYGRKFASFRIEGVYERNQFGSAKSLLPLAMSGDSAILSKSNEWSQYELPNNSYYDEGSSIISANILYDFELSPDWSAYFGAGIGLALLNFNYSNEFLRKSVGEGYLEVPFDVEWPVQAKVNAAGSLSSVSGTVEENALTYSLIAGLDLHRSDHVSLGVRLTWRSIGNVTRDSVLWTTIRSHAPVLADGSTPFETDWEFKSWSYLTVGLVVTRRVGGN